MRSRFERPAEDLTAFVRNATIVLDTSVLLGLYRLSAQSRVEALVVLEGVADRLWLPHQAGVEFYRNVATVRAELSQAYKKAQSELRSATGKAMQAFGDANRWKDTRTEVAKRIDTAVKALLKELSDLEAADLAPVSADDDPVLVRIEAIFEGRMGPEPSHADVRARVEEFVTWRAPNRIPPGFADVPAKHTPILQAGDYLLWCEVLDHAAGVDGPVLLVTNDAKSDWFTNAGETHPDLSSEFARSNGHGYSQATFDKFLEAAANVVGAEVATETVDEVVDEQKGVESRRFSETWLEILRMREEAARRQSPTYYPLFDRNHIGYPPGADSRPNQSFLEWAANHPPSDSERRLIEHLWGEAAGETALKRLLRGAEAFERRPDHWDSESDERSQNGADEPPDRSPDPDLD